MYKQDAISDIYQFMNIGQGIIYCNKKHKADELKMYLESHNFSVGTLHGDMMQKERENIMKEFSHMQKLDTIDKYREYMKTSSYWADTWTISALENKSICNSEKS